MQNTPTANNTQIRTAGSGNRRWKGSVNSLVYDAEGITTCLNRYDQPVYVVEYDGRVGVTNEGYEDSSGSITLVGSALPLKPEQLVASVELVTAMARAGLLSSFGSAGVIGARLEAAIRQVQSALKGEPYAFNLIHSPSEEAMERRAVELFLQYGVHVVEASAFLDLTAHVVRYRAAGLSLDPQGNPVIGNRIIAKVSRREVAQKFMEPAPDRLLQPLVASGLITEDQMQIARRLPMADDVTVEADSGGHTDNRPLVVILPSILSLRDELQAKHQFSTPVRVGAAGGIGTPSAALAAFMMGAAYVVTGSINQACVEASASLYTKKLLSEADMADVMMAPAADMFEMGVKVQLLKRGTMFPMRAQRLYELYREYDSVEAIPAAEREKLEKQVLKRPIDAIWRDTVAYFMERDPEQIRRAEDNPKRQMALIFRWYLGLSSRWSNTGEQGRELDYQIWCGPSMGAFNAWVKGTYLQDPANRSVVDVARQIMAGAAYLYRLQSLKMQGVIFAARYETYIPVIAKNFPYEGN
jgi:trans-AT polyketide synthase, acyltransferase and oxidoreductase domains